MIGTLRQDSAKSFHRVETNDLLVRGIVHIGVMGIGKRTLNITFLTYTI